jgi:hypothetical protein
MPTETLTPTAPTAVTPEPVVSAPAPAPVISFADALDKALGTSEPSKTPINEKAAVKAVKAEPAVEPAKTIKAEEAPKADQKAEPKSLKTPPSILDQLGTLGVEPKEEVKTEAKAEEPLSEVIAEPSTPAAQTAFAKLTKELREAKAKLKDFESKVANRTEAVEDKGGDVKTDSQLAEYQAKLEQFQKERDELEGELRISRVEATREYKTTIGEPIKQTTQTITDIAKVYELKASPILDAALETDGAKRRTILKELTSEMDPVDALAVRTKVDELALLNAKRDEVVRESKSALEAIARRDAEAEKASRDQYDQEARKAFGDVWNSFQEEMPLLKKIEGNEPWNKTIDELRANAEKLDSEPLDHKQRAALTYQAVTLPLVVQVFKDYVSKTNQELASLKNNLSEYRKATPGAGSGIAPAKTEKLDRGLSFLEALEKGL